MTERLYIRPPNWSELSEDEKLAWALAFVRAAAIAISMADDLDPAADSEDGD